jgi:hypothetical protein
MENIEFINGMGSHMTYLIIGRKGPSYMGLRRLATGGKPIYRVHCYPSLAAFKLPQPNGDTPGFKYTAVRREHGYETVHMEGDDETRSFLLPGLASRGVSAMEFDVAVKTLIEKKPGDNTLGNGGYQPSASGILGVLLEDEEEEEPDNPPQGLGNLQGEPDGANGEVPNPENPATPSTPGEPDDL